MSDITLELGPSNGDPITFEAGPGGAVDLTNYAKLDEANTFTAPQTFESPVAIGAPEADGDAAQLATVRDRVNGASFTADAAVAVGSVDGSPTTMDIVAWDGTSAASGNVPSGWFSAMQFPDLASAATAFGGAYPAGATVINVGPDGGAFFLTAETLDGDWGSLTVDGLIATSGGHRFIRQLGGWHVDPSPDHSRVSTSGFTGRLEDLTTQQQVNNVLDQLTPADIGAVDESTVGQPDGVASLDGGGKVPAAQLPNSVMDYRGAWNASTNSPALADGTGSAGDVWRVTVTGTQNLGSGPIAFDVGDYAIYNGSTWEKSGTTDAVVSFAGRTGAVAPADGDYDASEIVTDPATYWPSGNRLGGVLTAIDAALVDHGIMIVDRPTASAVAAAIAAVTPASIDAVPTSRTINGYDLSTNRSLTASDVSALPSSTVIPWASQIEINCAVRPPSTYTTWTPTESAVIGGGYAGGATGVAAETWTFARLPLSAGTWTIIWTYRRSSAGGIITPTLGGTSLATVDTYGATTAGSLRATQTGITVAADGRYDLVLTNPTKNASASAYGWTLQTIALVRTGS